MINLLVYFVVGFLLDMLATLDIQAVQKDQAVKSASVSFTGTMLSYYVFYDIIVGPDFVLGLLSYALGGAAGAIVTMRSSVIKKFILKFFPGKRKYLPGTYVVAPTKSTPDTSMKY